MAQRSFYDAGSMPRGSRSVEFFRATDAAPAVWTSIGTYILEADAPSRPSTITERRGTKNEATDWAASIDFDTLSGTAQLADSNAKPLQRFDRFIDTFDSQIGAEAWVVTEVSQPEG
ncbi:MAG TPA: hypothetical protein VE843_02010, partial [Ktedonobacteraceae bacterium]|nr:hypothetical protein [Ktedonobacteraceae bacterium]